MTLPADEPLRIPAHLVVAAMECRLNAHHRLIGLEAEKGYAPSVATVYHRQLLSRLQADKDDVSDEPYSAGSAITWDTTTPDWETLDQLVMSRHYTALEHYPINFNGPVELSCRSNLQSKDIELTATADAYDEKGINGQPIVFLLRTSATPPNQNLYPLVALFYLIAKHSGKTPPLVHALWLPRNASKRSCLEFNSNDMPGKEMGLEQVITDLIDNIIYDKQNIQTSPASRLCYSCPVRDQGLCPVYPIVPNSDLTVPMHKVMRGWGNPEYDT